MHQSYLPRSICWKELVQTSLRRLDRHFKLNAYPVWYWVWWSVSIRSALSRCCKLETLIYSWCCAFVRFVCWSHLFFRFGAENKVLQASIRTFSIGTRNTATHHPSLFTLSLCGCQALLLLIYATVEKHTGYLPVTVFYLITKALREKLLLHKDLPIMQLRQKASWIWETLMRFATWDRQRIMFHTVVDRQTWNAGEFRNDEIRPWIELWAGFICRHSMYVQSVSELIEKSYTT